ncbi:MAG: hypothetical protein QOE70_3803 [Chthoniobacter sp.]|jgi:cell fate (sporulation/competence/biofilm development) regulator YlbF (YheA/YmcA/DUF963 family)|nr:hypothetical protein [Chthoniobacter sp.]
MDTATAESQIIQRTLDLCQAIAEQPDFQALKERLDAFMSDEYLKFQYQQVNDLGQLLQMKQSDGLELKPEELAHFETMREELLKNPTAQGFIDAQQQMQQLHQAVGKLIDKTFELGRRPKDEDLQDGSCCGGCGCH